MPDQSWDENAFINATPDMRFGMMFAQHREIRSRVGGLESQMDVINKNILELKESLSQKLDVSIEGLLEKLKPLQSEKEKAEILVKADEKRHSQFRSTVSFICLVIVPTVVIALGACNFVVAWYVKTQVHVPIPTVEVAPPPSFESLHPVQTGN